MASLPTGTVTFLFTDIEGSTRLLQQLGARRYARLLADHHRLLRAAFEETGGEQRDSQGDGLFFSFPSAKAAVLAAVAAQRAVLGHSWPEGVSVRVRMGLHTGEPISGDTGYVSVDIHRAARICAAGHGGQVLVSQTTHDLVAEDLPDGISLRDMGQHTLKDLTHPQHLFQAVVADLPVDFPPLKSLDALPNNLGVARRVVAFSWWKRALALVGLVLLLGGGVTVWQRSVRPSSPAGMVPAVQPRLSLVVLPFQNLSGDASQEYYADGITEDLTTDLAHIPGAFVIARTSAFVYKGRPVEVKKVGEELGVRYVVEGSVRRIEDVLRVNVQLIATESGTHLWSDRFDVAVKSLAQGQEDIVRRISTTLNVQIVDVESARSARERPTSPDAFDLILQARALHSQPPSRQREGQVLGLYERALQLDQSSVAAMLGIANTIINRSLGFLGQWVTADELARAAKLVAEARAIAPNAEAVLENVALLHQAHENWEDTATAAARLVEAYPNNAAGYELLATAKRYTGHADEAIALYDTSIRLNPLDPNLYLRYGFRAYALLQIGRYDETVVWVKRSLAANPEAPAPIRSARYRMMAVAHALAGRLEEARQALEAANKLWPYSTVRSNVPENLASPVLAAQLHRYQEGARLAGLRDHANEDANFNVPSSGELSGNLAGWTPTTVPGAVTIRTAELPALLAQRKPVVIDTATHSTGRSIPGAIGLKQAGSGGTFVDAAQQHLRPKLMELTGGDLSRPIVAVGYNSERFDGHNLALRLVRLGYTNVYWYRGGREAWEVARLPETPLKLQDW